MPHDEKGGFTTRPSLKYNETFSAGDSFGPYVFNTTGDPGFSPYLAFDTTGAYMISTASHFDTGVVKTVNSPPETDRSPCTATPRRR